MHLKPCVARKEDNYFFALSKYETHLQKMLNENPNFVQPSFRLNEVRSRKSYVSSKFDNHHTNYLIQCFQYVLNHMDLIRYGGIC